MLDGDTIAALGLDSAGPTTRGQPRYFQEARRQRVRALADKAALCRNLCRRSPESQIPGATMGRARADVHAELPDIQRA